jgi:hypothetical protein
MRSYQITSMLELRHHVGHRVSEGRRERTIALAQKKRKGGMGFVEEDNSGKSNIFAVEPKTLYTSSPRADSAARQGLGGSQGLAIILAISIIVVGFTFVTVGMNPTDGTVDPYPASSSLQDIAARLQ